MERAANRRSVLVGAVAASAGLALAKVASTTAQDATPVAASSFPVNLIFVNAMTSMDKIDIYVNGSDKDQRVLEGLAYGTASQQFAGTSPATVILVKNNVEWGIDNDLFNTALPTSAGATYVVVISDFIISPLALDLSNPGEGNAHTVGLHAAAQAPAVDVYVTPNGKEFAIGDYVPLISGLSYGYSTTGGPLPEGTYDIRLTQTGTDTVALEQVGTTVTAGNSYAFVLIGKPGSTEQPLSALVVSLPTVS